MIHRLIPSVLLAGAALLGACAGEERQSATPPTGGVVDSALPIPVLLDRFRATIPDTPQVLGGGAESPRELAEALLTALTRHDTASLRALVMSRAEFAWLYYPHSRYTRPPYELGPELVWIQLSATSEKGATRLLRRYGGLPLDLEAVRCPASAVTEGPNRTTPGCTVRFAVGDSSARDVRLFGSLLNRDGRYKFLSYANDL